MLFLGLLRWLYNFFFNFCFNVYLFLGQRETEHERGRVRERGRHRIGNRLQALSHQPRAWRRARTQGPRDRDLAEIGRLTDCASQAPLNNVFWRTCFLSLNFNFSIFLFYIMLLVLHLRSLCLNKITNIFSYPLSRKFYCFVFHIVYMYIYDPFELIFVSTFIYFWDRERQSMNGGGAEREGDTESEDRKSVV